MRIEKDGDVWTVECLTVEQNYITEGKSREIALEKMARSLESDLKKTETKLLGIKDLLEK